MKNDDDDDEDRRAIADRTLLFDNSSMIDMGILNDLVGGGDCNALYLLLLYFRDNDCSIEFSKVCRKGARLLDSRRHWLCAGMVSNRDTALPSSACCSCSGEFANLQMFFCV